MIGLRSQAIRTVLRWQLMATVALAVIAALAAGQHGAISAVLGGLVSFAAGLAMLAALRAEAVKIVLVVALLWIVLTVYQNVVIVAFIGTFIVTTIVFALALFVRE